MRTDPWMAVRRGAPSSMIQLLWTFWPIAAMPKPGPKPEVVTLEAGPRLMPPPSSVFSTETA